MKLEIIHISPYLLSELKLVDTETKEVFDIAGINIQNNEVLIHDNIDGSVEEYDINILKPGLTPLKDFNKGIARDIMKQLNCRYIVVSDIWGLEDGSIDIKDVRVETYNVMCRNKIDFNNLIPKGLAVDINTL